MFFYCFLFIFDGVFSYFGCICDDFCCSSSFLLSGAVKRTSFSVEWMSTPEMNSPPANRSREVAQGLFQKVFPKP